MSLALRTSPTLVAAVLAHYDQHGLNATARDCKIHKRTLWRWIAARAADPDWLDNETSRWSTRNHAALRDNAAHLADYRKRRYLTGRQTVPAIGTQRRIQALHAMGWTTGLIAECCGWESAEAVSEIRKRKRVTRATAATISAAYDALSMRVGPSAKTRRLAARNGWLPPLAWDDIDNDVEPCSALDTDSPDDVIVDRLLLGERVTSTRAEKEEAMRRWLADGKSQRELCLMHGWKEGRYVERKVA